MNTEEMNALEVHLFKQRMKEQAKQAEQAANEHTPNECPKCKGLGYCRCEIASNE